MVTSRARRRLLARRSRSHAPARGPADGRGRARGATGCGHRPETAAGLRAPPLPARVTAREVAPAGQSARKGSGRGARERGRRCRGSSGPAPRMGTPQPRPPGPAHAGSWDVQGSPPVDAPGVQSLVTEEGYDSPGLRGFSYNFRNLSLSLSSSDLILKTTELERT